MRIIGVVTTSRSDYGIYRPLLRLLHDDPDFSLRLYVSGAHLSPRFGMTVNDILQDGFSIAERIEIPLDNDSPGSIGNAVGVALSGFSKIFERAAPDILVVLGDRTEMLASVVAAISHGLPIAHIHGGESSEGATDELVRHAITKMSHLHFVATQTSRERVIQMGEEPWRVTVVGAPSLDNLNLVALMSKVELEKVFGLSLRDKPIMVTYHPVTLERDAVRFHLNQLLSALAKIHHPIIFTYPNADSTSHYIIEEISNFVRQNNLARLSSNLGTQVYFSLMNQASMMVGNSSSGIIEAASFRLPVVNIGIRQQGRLRAKNVIDVPEDEKAILAAIRRAGASSFKSKLKSLKNPYGDGHAAQRILRVLSRDLLGPRLMIKKFYSFKWSMSSRMLVAPNQEF